MIHVWSVTTNAFQKLRASTFHDKKKKEAFQETLSFFQTLITVDSISLSLYFPFLFSPHSQWFYFNHFQIVQRNFPSAKRIYDPKAENKLLFTIDTCLFISTRKVLFAEDFCRFHLTFAYSIIARN